LLADWFFAGGLPRAGYRFGHYRLRSVQRLPLRYGPGSSGRRGPGRFRCITRTFPFTGSLSDAILVLNRIRADDGFFLQFCQAPSRGVKQRTAHPAGGCHRGKPCNLPVLTIYCDGFVRQTFAYMPLCGCRRWLLLITTTPPLFVAIV